MKLPAKKIKITDLVTVVLFCLFLLAAGVLTVALPSRAFSQNENRTLMTGERLLSGATASRIFDGGFEADAGDYFRDQFPLRETMLKVKTLSDIALVRMETNGVIYGSSGYQIPRPAQAQRSYTAQNAAAVSLFRQELEERGIPFVFAVAPRPADVLVRYYPSAYTGAELENERRELFSAAPFALDLREPILEGIGRGEYLYYRTDHHWTTEGAFRAYTVIAEALGVTPYPISDFTRETASAAFYGTTYSKTLSPFTVPDTMEYFRYEGDEDFTTSIADTGVSFSGFYDRCYLEKKDQYSSFLSGNNARVTIRKNGGEDRPLLLLVKDSYSHSLAPFLARHFDLDLIDPRYYNDTVARLLDGERPDAVLILCGLDTVTDSAALSKLAFGLGRS